ncbi:MAG: hypothetical protein Q9169_005576 [Polycauliona sp. 2 TL-2023]
MTRNGIKLGEFSQKGSLRPPVLFRYRSSKWFIGIASFIATFTDGVLYSVVSIPNVQTAFILESFLADCSEIVPLLPFTLVERSGVAPEMVQSWITILFVVFGVSMVLGAPIAGWVTQHSSLRQIPLVAGLTAALAATLLFMLANATYLLVIARCLQGVSAGVVYTTVLALLVESVERDEVGSWVGFALSGVNLGVLAAPAIAGVLYEKAGYYAVFAVCLVIIVVDLLAALLLIDKKRAQQWSTHGQQLGGDSKHGKSDSVRPCIENTAGSQESGVLARTTLEGGNQNGTATGYANPRVDETSSLLQNGSSKIKTSPPQKWFPTTRALLASPQILAALYGSFVHSTLHTSFDAVLPRFVQRTFHWSPSGAGLAFLTLTVPSLMTPLYGFLGDRYGRRVVALCGFGLAIPSLALLGIVHNADISNIVLLCLFLVLVGMGINLFLTSLVADMSFAVDRLEQEDDQVFEDGNAFTEAYALVDITFGAGAVIGPLISGLLYENTTWAITAKQNPRHNSGVILNEPRITENCIAVDGEIGSNSKRASVENTQSQTDPRQTSEFHLPALTLEPFIIMVNTRGQKPSSTQIDPALDQPSPVADIEAAAPLHVDLPAHDVSPPTHPRLRKRRRSTSPTIDDSPRASKRSNLRKSPSPAARRISNTVHLTSQSSHYSPPHRIRSPTPHAPSTGLEEEESRDDAAIRRILQEHSDDPSLSEHEENVTAEDSPNMHAVMSRIIDHGETIDNQYGAHRDLANGLPHSANVVPRGASLQLRVQSLPILDNLARQVLATFANSSYSEILVITSDNDSEPSQAYSTLKALFDHTKKVYSIRTSFLSPSELGLIQREQAETIRKANLATFVSSVFGSQDVGFYDLDEFFLDTFLADGGRLLKTQAGLFLDLKTQAYISAIAHGDRPREDVLQDLFPDDIEQRLLDRRSGAKQLGPGEIDFIQRSNNRKKTLLEESLTEEAIAQLPHRYVWDEFLRDISGYVSKNSVSLLGVPVNGRKTLSQTRATNQLETDRSQHTRRQAPRKQTRGQPSPEPEATPTPAPMNAFVQVAQMVAPSTDNITEKAARAAQFALEDFGVSNESANLSQNQRQDPHEQQPQQYPFQFEQQPAPYYTHQNQFDNNDSTNQQQISQPSCEQPEPRQGTFMPAHVPFPTQTAPTSILYERARQAATAKASPSNKRAGHPSQRRPWSTEEENALMSGLDAVKGPHWSQILALYGAGGTMNETLKDRNQVQLKDKARNLKLFFLKSGIEVPYYLQFVTGELKTRAPQVAALQRGENAAKRLEEQQVDGNGDGNGNGSSTRIEDDAQRIGNDGGVVGPADTNNMEDGEGEVIDPADEYASVHASHVSTAIQTATTA